MSGAGNIFTVISDLFGKIKRESLSGLAVELCSAKKLSSMDTDGLLLIGGWGKDYDFSLEFFNPDGSGGMLCGNGARCGVKYTYLKGFIRKESNIHFKFANTIFRAEIVDENIKLELPPPKRLVREIKLQSSGRKIQGSYLDVGTVHLVLDFADLTTDTGFDSFELKEFAQALRYHEIFAPVGVNVNIYNVIDETTLRLRTYEKGVEAETGACGTGAISTAIAAYYKKQIKLPVTIIPTSRMPLVVDSRFDAECRIDSVFLTGGAEVLTEEDIDIPTSYYNE
jgi:diaminopimelate epimerase